MQAKAFSLVQIGGEGRIRAVLGLACFKLPIRGADARGSCRHEPVPQTVGGSHCDRSVVSELVTGHQCCDWYECALSNCLLSGGVFHVVN